MYILIAKNRTGRTTFTLDTKEKVNMIKQMLFHHYKETEIAVIKVLKFEN